MGHVQKETHYQEVLQWVMYRRRHTIRRYCNGSCIEGDTLSGGTAMGHVQKETHFQEVLQWVVYRRRHAITMYCNW